MGQAKAPSLPSMGHSQGRRNTRTYVECRTGTEGDCKLGLKVRLEPWCEGFLARLRNPHLVREAPGASAGFGHNEQENTLPYRKVLLTLMWNSAESCELGDGPRTKSNKESNKCVCGERGK